MNCNFLLKVFRQKITMKTQQKQECIPVGCVPSTAVAVGWVCLGGGVCLPKAVCVCLGGVSALGVSAWGCLPEGVHLPPVDRILDTRL